MEPNPRWDLPAPERLLGVPVHPVSYHQARDIVADVISDGHKRPAFSIVQANAYSLVTAQESPEYQHVLEGASMTVADGMPLVWMLRHKGHHASSRVYGPDLMLMLCEDSARRGWRCYLYGGSPGVAEQLRDVLTARYPGLTIVGTYSPPFRTLTPEEDEAICQRISGTRPDILWVGLGGPKQDIWMHQHRGKIDVSVMHGVGAAFDFLSGRIPQAPRWMMNAGLEWLFRLGVEPRRLWKRYTVINVKFLYYLLLRDLTHRTGR